VPKLVRVCMGRFAKHQVPSEGDGSLFDDSAVGGYNRSYLMPKMSRILEIRYRDHKTFSGGLPKAVDRLMEMAQGELLPHSEANAPRVP